MRLQVAVRAHPPHCHCAKRPIAIVKLNPSRLKGDPELHPDFLSRPGGLDAHRQAPGGAEGQPRPCQAVETCRLRLQHVGLLCVHQKRRQSMQQLLAALQSSRSVLPPSAPAPPASAHFVPPPVLEERL